MNWVIWIVLMIGVGIFPRLIANAVQDVVESDNWDRDRKVNKINNRILIFSWIIIITATLYPYLFDFGYKAKIEELEKRIEVLETQPQIDTVSILEVLPNE